MVDTVADMNPKRDNLNKQGNWTLLKQINLNNIKSSLINLNKRPQPITINKAIINSNLRNKSNNKKPLTIEINLKAIIHINNRMMNKKMAKKRKKKNLKTLISTNNPIVTSQRTPPKTSTNKQVRCTLNHPSRMTIKTESSVPPVEGNSAMKLFRSIPRSVLKSSFKREKPLILRNKERL